MLFPDDQHDVDDTDGAPDDARENTEVNALAHIEQMSNPTSEPPLVIVGSGSPGRGRFVRVL